MVDPLSTAAGWAAKRLGEAFGAKLTAWAKGSEPKQLVKLLEAEHPSAPRMLLQPAVLQELWWYSTTGELRETALLEALRPIAADERERRALAEAIRSTQWQVMPADAELNWQLLRLRDDLRQARATEHVQLLEELEGSIERALAALRPRLPVARGLLAETDPFVDREAALADAEACIAESDAEAAGETSARVLSCNGMPGVGSSALGLRLAHRHAERFPGGALYADFRRANGEQRSPEEVAGQLLRDIGVAPEAIPADAKAQLGTLRSLLAEMPFLLLLDNVRREQDVRPLIPANRESVVIATSGPALAGIGVARLIPLEPLAEADGLDLLRRLGGSRVEHEPDAAREIVRACQGLPLALSLAGAKLRRRSQLTLADYARTLADERRRVAHLSDGERALSATFATSTSGLEQPARRLLLLLAALDVGVIEPSICAALLDTDESVASAALGRLEDEGLLLPAVDGRRSMHGLLRLWARECAERELEPDLIVSASNRRVQWLVEAANARSAGTPAED